MATISTLNDRIEPARNSSRILLRILLSIFFLISIIGTFQLDHGTLMCHNDCICKSLCDGTDATCEYFRDDLQCMRVFARRTTESQVYDNSSISYDFENLLVAAKSEFDTQNTTEDNSNNDVMVGVTMDIFWLKEETVNSPISSIIAMSLSFWSFWFMIGEFPLGAFLFLSVFALLIAHKVQSFS